MSQQDSPQNFFDTRTIISLVIMGVVFIGWQIHLQRKYPDAFAKKTAGTAPQTSGTAETGEKAAPSTQKSVPTMAAGQKGSSETGVAGSGPVSEKLTHYKGDTMSFDLSSKGMGVKNFEAIKYKDRKGDTVTIGQVPNVDVLPLETRLLGRTDAIDFAIERVNDNLYVGHAQVGDLKLTKTLEIEPEKYLLQFKVSAVGADPRFVGLTTDLIEQADAPGATSLLPQHEKQEFYVDTVENHDRKVFKKEDIQASWSKVKVASIGSQFFAQALVDKSQVIPDSKGVLNVKDQVAQITLQYPVLNPGQEFQIEYSAFMGPKAYDLLRSIDPALAGVVDFGWFTFIARHIFDLLKWLHSLVGNWGVAIICLTLVVRALVLPFNIYSYKSMKQMQAIQPQIQAMKDRYKDDQQKANAEVMRLMRENKVNPVGGCLPVLLQFPIFIALYSVVGHTIELYQAPFILWIHDLSLKDPYYILPVLMGLTMFVQQKTTPNASMDPAQAKVLMMMPLLFTFFMISLPSGLTLYMLVGALFSVVQQTYFMRTTKAVVKA